MVGVYHSTPRAAEQPSAGETYRGSDRELLSELLGGPVGFAYHPKAYPTFGNWVVALDDDCPVIISLDGDDIPRRDYSDVTFLDYLCRGKFWFGRADQMPVGQGEIAFLAEKAVFLAAKT